MKRILTLAIAAVCLLPFSLSAQEAPQACEEAAKKCSNCHAVQFELIEFELPFENSRLEAYKFAAQWTFRTALYGQFIDGGQLIIEPDTSFEIWNLTFLYLAGLRLNDRWSALSMIGVRPEIAQGRGFTNTDGIANLTIFRDFGPHSNFGLESNVTFGSSDRTSLLLIPQIDLDLTEHWQLQVGGGAGFSAEGTEPMVALRWIFNR